MMNTSSSNRGQVKLKIPPAYIPDPWICNHQRKRSELVSESLALSEQHRKEIQESLKRRNRRSLKPFLTGIVRPKPFIQASSNNKSDKIPAVCKPDNNEPVKTRKIGLNNCSSPKKPNFKSIKSGVSKALVKLKPLYLNKPHGIAKPGLNIKKKLTSIKPKSLSRNSSIKKSPKKVANSSILSKSSKSKANEKASLLEDPFQTADWNFSDCLQSNTFFDESKFSTGDIKSARKPLKLKSKSENHLVKKKKMLAKKTFSDPSELCSITNWPISSSRSNHHDLSFHPNINNCSSIKNLLDESPVKCKRIKRRHTLASVEDLKHCLSMPANQLSSKSAVSRFNIDSKPGQTSGVKSILKTNANNALASALLSTVKFALPAIESKWLLRRSTSDTEIYKLKQLSDHHQSNNMSLNLQRFLFCKDSFEFPGAKSNNSVIESSTGGQIDQFESEWIESGKTRFGLQVERLIRRYKKLSKQKRYLMFFIVILTFFTTFSLLIIILLLVSGPRSHLIYVNADNLTNNTTSWWVNNYVPGSEGLKNTESTRPPTLGLIGDLCVKVVGDCDKYMECRKQNVGAIRVVSTCACMNGYIGDANRQCKGLSGSYCESNGDCGKNSICNLREKKCICQDGYHPRPDKSCFAKYNSKCDTDSDCLKNGECRQSNDTATRGLKVCRCSSKDRTMYKPEYEPYRQCRLLIGAKCEENLDCIENARCNKYCSCREIDLYFETEEFLCEDGCKHKKELISSAGVAIKFRHPRKCGYYFTCSPRDLDLCPSNYIFDPASQSCNSTTLCRRQRFLL